MISGAWIMEQVYIIVFVDFSVFNGLRDHCFEKTTKNSQNLHSAHVMIFLIPQNLNRILTKCQNPDLEN